MSPRNLFTDTSGWSEEEAPVEGYAGSLAGASGGGRDENGATGHESVVAGESDAFQSYILEMSKHRLLSHPETVTLAKTTATSVMPNRTCPVMRG